MNRKLGAGERVTWLTAQAGSVNFAVIAHVAGPLQEHVVREALNLLCQRHPLLSVRVEVKDQPVFTSENVPEIPLRIETRHSDDHWQKEAEREVNQKFSWLEGPLVRVVLLKGTTAHDIIITFHHVIGDITSGVCLIRDLLSLAEHMDNGDLPEVDPLPERPPVEELLPRSAHGLEAQVKTASLIWKQMKNIFIQRPKKLPQDDSSGALHARNIYRILSEEETEAFLTKCHEESTTVHGAVCAAVLKAAANQIYAAVPENPLIISCMSMVNLRQFLNPPLEDEIGFYVSTIITAHRISPSTTFWDLARDTKNEVHKSLDSGEPFVFLSLLDRFAPKSVDPDDFARRISRIYPSAVMVTNAGLLDIPEQYGPFVLEDLRVAVANKATPELFNLAVLTYRNRLLLDFFYAEPTFSQERAAALVEDTMKEVSISGTIQNE
jgi:NRPS condensation-like uncharacterized protein